MKKTNQKAKQKNLHITSEFIAKCWRDYGPAKRVFSVADLDTFDGLAFADFITAAAKRENPLSKSVDIFKVRRFLSEKEMSFKKSKSFDYEINNGPKIKLDASFIQALWEPFSRHQNIVYALNAPRFAQYVNRQAINKYGFRKFEQLEQNGNPIIEEIIQRKREEYRQMGS